MLKALAGHYYLATTQRNVDLRPGKLRSWFDEPFKSFRSKPLIRINAVTVSIDRAREVQIVWILKGSRAVIVRIQHRKEQDLRVSLWFV